MATFINVTGTETYPEVDVRREGWQYGPVEWDQGDLTGIGCFFFGWYDPSNRWNGWVRPQFTLAEAQRIAAWNSAAHAEDPLATALLTWDEEREGFWHFDANYADEYAAEGVRGDFWDAVWNEAAGQNLYEIGSGWTWSVAGVPFDQGDCPSCEGIGAIPLGDDEVDCPICEGTGTEVADPEQWTRCANCLNAVPDSIVSGGLCAFCRNLGWVPAPERPQDV